MQTDYVQRFLFENLDIRGRLVCLTGAWQRMLDGRDYPQDIASLLGHTTALNVLLGANQKGAGRVTLQVQGSGPVKLLVADCTAELRIRGMATYDKELGAALSEREPARRRPPLGDARGREERRASTRAWCRSKARRLEQIFVHYLAQSEQMPAFLRLYADGGALVRAAAREAAATPTAATPTAGTASPTSPRPSTLDETRDAQPYDLLTRVFPEELMRVFRLYAVEYHCPYDEDKVKDMLRGLGRREVEAILAEQGEVVIRNEMCNHEYRFDARAIAELFH